MDVSGEYLFDAPLPIVWAALLDPKQGMRSREIQGGTGPAAVAAALAEANQRLNRMMTL